MIIIQYPYTNDGVIYNDKVKIYSDNNFQIEQKETGKIFDNVIDNYPSPYTYIETDILIDDLNSIIEEKAQAYDVIMGVSE